MTSRENYLHKELIPEDEPDFETVLKDDYIVFKNPESTLSQGREE